MFIERIPETCDAEDRAAIEQRNANAREWLRRMNAAIINGKPEVAAYILATQLMGKQNARG